MIPVNDDIQMYTVEESCHMLRIGRTTFYKFVSTGELKIVKLGSRTLVRRSELRQFAKLHVSHGRSEPTQPNFREYSYREIPPPPF